MDGRLNQEFSVWMCVSRSNKDDLASSVVLEMLVDVGIPWKVDFLSCVWVASQILLDELWWMFLHY